MSRSAARLALALAAAALAPAAAAAQDLSPLGLVRDADMVVKAVMAALAAASVAAWTILLVKIADHARANRALGRGRAVIEAAADLPAAVAAVGGPGTAARMLHLAAGELARSGPLPRAAGVQARIASLLAQEQAQAARAMARGTGILASIGSVAPFVGLFGTVWGIMDAFTQIARTGGSSLAVVAPGIAEALLATAMGLVAAIPAVLIYNALSRAQAGYRLRLAAAAAGVERLVSRDLDRAEAGRRGD